MITMENNRLLIFKKESARGNSNRVQPPLETMLMKLLIILLGFGFIIHASIDAPKVKTPWGRLKGYYKISQNDEKYEAYEGIPYAMQPVGKLRFESPQQIQKWYSELSATKFGPNCIQYEQIPQTSPKVVGAEDCLYLNIYVPLRKKESNKTLRPVLFWIHGGAFQFGSGKEYGAKYLIDRGVILVTINYRVGPMGFLSTEDKVVPGNMGLKDQNMALRWVSHNIKSFGGDPKKVTLVGWSAGGASVQYHHLSPMSAGLFRGGISFSGTAFDCWAQTENSLEKAKKLSASLGCPTTCSRDMIRCLKSCSPHDIVNATSEFLTFFYNPFTPFGPVVEKCGAHPFMNKTPIESINSNNVRRKVPWVTGTTKEDGLFPMAEFIANKQSLKQLNDKWDTMAPDFLDFNYTIPKEKHVETARRIKKHYFGTKQIDRQSVKELIKMLTDRFFATDGRKAALMQAKIGPVWFYQDNYRGAQSFSNYLSGTTENYGVCHGDDVLFVLNNTWVDPTTTQKDLDMQKHLINFWVSFATNGIPTTNVKWSKLDPSKKKLDYLQIGPGNDFVMKSTANFGDQKFWNSIDFKENKSN